MTTTSTAPATQLNIEDLVTVSGAMTEALAARASGQTTIELPREALEAMANILRLHTKGEVPVEAGTEYHTAKQLTQKLATFVEAYKIRAIEGEPSQVAQTIPTDRTYADYLREGQALSIALHAAFPGKYKADQAIWPASLEKLEADPAFKAKGTGLETMTDGCVSGTNGEGMNRKGATQELAKQGLQHEKAPVLVAAHTGRYLVDATSIFQGQVVRAAGGVFFFDDDGLGARDIRVGLDVGSSDVSASARRAPSELKT
jgi:hypothetical protein